MKKRTQTGICKLCKEEKQLSYEHIPPRSAFNKDTRFFELNSTDYFVNALDYIDGKKRPNKKVEQGGLGNYSLCEKCNGFLGQKYVREYKKFAEISYSVINRYPDSKSYTFDIADVDVLKFMKQVIAIFICCNKPNFTDSYDGLIEFVMDENSNYLPERYKLYMYLNQVGTIRNGNVMYTNIDGNFSTICEFTFKPFGFVLSIDSPPIKELSNITDFKKCPAGIKFKKLPVLLNKYPTILPFPLDYRTREEIDNIKKPGA